MSKGVSGTAFDIQLFKRVMTFVRPYRRTFYETFILVIILSLLGIVRPLLLGDMIDDHVAYNDPVGLMWMAIWICVILILESLMQLDQAYWTSWIGEQVTFDLRTKLFDRIVGFKLKYFDTKPIGTLVTRVVSDIGTINDIFSQGLITIMGDLLKLTAVLVTMFVLNWKLALLCIIPIPVLLWATNIFKNAIRSSFQMVRDKVSELNAFVQEHIQGMNIVQVFGMEKEEFEKFKAINKGHRTAHIRSVWAYSVFFPVVEMLSATSLALLVWWGTKGVLSDIFSLGEMISFILFINMLYRPIRQLADRFNVLQMGMVGSERVFHVMDTDAEIPNTGSINASKIRGQIEFKDLWFAYNEPEWVLKGVNFTVHPGEMIAIVGATGSGKSSLINVLSRSYEYQKGEVLLDGKDIRQYEQGSLRSAISVVLQDVFLFSDNIHNNVTLNDPTITREQVIEAAKVVGAHDFIMRTQHGYDTDVKERGATLSVGQRQLLAFMRAYVSEPSILILDEATSSVDSNSELMIQEAAERITKGRTSMVIAHRLSTIQKADRIIVLEKGRIVESGSHQELLALDGHYKRSYDLQFR